MNAPLSDLASNQERGRQRGRGQSRCPLSVLRCLYSVAHQAVVDTLLATVTIVFGAPAPHPSPLTPHFHRLAQ